MKPRLSIQVRFFGVRGDMCNLTPHYLLDVKGTNVLFQGLTSNEIVGRDLANHPPEVIGQFEQGGRRHFVYAARPLPSPGTWDMSHYYSEAQEYCLIDLGHGPFLVTA